MSKIAFIGNFNPPYSTENDLLWSLNELGHTVFPLQENEYWTNDILDLCLEQEVDVLLYVHTHTWETPHPEELDLDQLFKILDTNKIATASFHLDTWWGLDRQTDVGNHPFWRTKYVFTADGDPKVEALFVEKGINHFWLPPGVSKKYCYWATPRDEFQQDIIFVGSKTYHPEWSYRPQLINWLHETYGERFTHYGNDGVRSIRGPELNELYRSARIVVGDSLNYEFSHEKYWSDRVPETLGRGGFLIHPRVPGLEDFYEDKKHLVMYDYNDFDQLKAHIDYYLSDYYERERIRLEGHRLVKEHQTYNNRMAYMLDTIEKQEAK